MKKLLVALAILPLVASLTVLGTAGTASAAKPAPAPSTLQWAGYTWSPRSVAGNPGAPQQWSPSNVTVDAQHRLHLRVTRDKKGHYTQAELDSTRRGWGYGTYRWTVDTDVTTLPPEVVLGLFTYGQDPAYGHREIDIEGTGWGSTPITWDYTTWANGHLSTRHVAPSGPTTQQIDWQPGHLTWTSYDALGDVISTSSASGADVPVPGDESIGMNLWVCGCQTGWQQTPAAEVVLSGFSFTPAS
jgi:hypothetical protein